MPTYKVTDPQTGKTLRLTGDSPPTEEELTQIFGATRQQKSSIPSLADVTKFVLPAATNIATDVGATVKSRMNLKALDKIKKSNDEFAQRLLKKAQDESDPEKKQKYLDLFRSFNSQVSPQEQDLTQIDKMSSDVNKSSLERGVAAAGEIGSLFVPGGQAGSTTGARRIASAGIQGATAGAIRGATRTQEATGKEDALARAKQTFVEGLLGGAVGAGIQTGFEGVGVARQSINELRKGVKDKALDVYASTLKENKTALKRMSKLGGDKAVSEKALLADGIPNSKNGVEKEFANYKPKFEEKIDELLQNSKEKVEPVSSLESIKQEIAKELDRPETRGEYKQAIDYLDDAIDSYKKPLSVTEANNLRKNLDKLVGEKTFADAKGKEKAIKMFAGALRNELKDKVPDARLLFDRYSLLATLSEVMKREPNISLPEILGGAVGLGGYGAPGGIGGFLIATGIRKPSVTRAVADLLYGFGAKAVDVVKQPGIVPGIPLMGAFASPRNFQPSPEEERQMQGQPPQGGL